ncbi:MAG: lamin tail domain-containing protein, partial [Rudaea sp.]
LGRNDEINLYDGTGTLVDRLTYGDQNFAGTIRTQNVSGIVPVDGLGSNTIADWSLSAVDDAEHSVASTQGDVGSPGRSSLITAGHAACPILGPLMRITEYMYDSDSDGEYVEFTNVGDSAQDMAGWSFDDSHEAPGTVDLSGYGSVQPGESVLLTDLDPATFRTDWNLCQGQKVIGNNASDNLGRGDEINLYDTTQTLIDRLTYGDQDFPGTIRTKNAGGWVSGDGLGQNLIADWTLATLGDAENSFASIHGAVGSPGASTRAIYAYDACVGSPGAPTIVVDPVATSQYLDLAANGSGSVSGVIDDPGDPAATTGIGFDIASSSVDVSMLTVTATSSNATVVPVAGLALTGNGATRRLRIMPSAVGHSTITLRVSDPDNNAGTYVVQYAASAASPTPATSRFHTGASDASSAIALDADTMLVGDDENQMLRIYARDYSGLALGGFDFSADLALTDLDNGTPREVDIEACARNGNRVYWAGSHSNSDSGDVRPDRHRVFATDLSGSGANTMLTYVGRYDFLLDDLVAWDQANANALGLAASSAAGVSAKQADGFNIEGMAMAPDGTSAFVAFRAPLLPVDARRQALIVPVRNFDALVTGNGTTGSLAPGSASFGTPILLDLAGRGIREIVRNGNGQYLLIAGPPGSDTGVAPADFRLFTWTGDPADKPIELAADLTSLQADGSWESIVDFPDTVGPATAVQLLVDNGNTVWYGDGVAAKDLVDKHLSKFRSDRLNIDVPLAADVVFRDGMEQR